MHIALYRLTMVTMWFWYRKGKSWRSLLFLKDMKTYLLRLPNLSASFLIPSLLAQAEWLICFCFHSAVFGNIRVSYSMCYLLLSNCSFGAFYSLVNDYYPSSAPMPQIGKIFSPLKNITLTMNSRAEAEFACTFFAGVDSIQQPDRMFYI